MTYVYAVEERLLQLVQLEEERFVTGFHQNVENKRKKVWHDRHIKYKQFLVEGHFLMYDNNFFKHLRKLRTHWLGPYIFAKITDEGYFELQNLDGTSF